jgi:monoamine oxidase
MRAARMLLYPVNQEVDTMSNTSMEADVCVVGAGLAGMTAARRLSQAGKSVVVLEARDRVGGRVWTQTSQTGVPVDMGGCFIGPDHERMHALTKEMGVSVFPTNVKGDNVLATGGKVRRYKGDIPRISPIALLSAGQAIARMNAMAKTLDVSAPWEATKALEWDAQSCRSWLTPTHVPTRLARDLVEATIRACFAAELSEVSLLNWLFLCRSAGGIEALMNIEGGYQHEQFEGGVQAVPIAMAAELGDAVVLESPVTGVVQTKDAVTVSSAKATVTTRHLVMALPRALAAGIQFDPVLPADHVLLIHQMPAGTEIKTVAVYGEPFWRNDGISGNTVATDDDIEISLDTTQPGHSEGVMATYCAGPRARKVARLPLEERRAMMLKMLTTRLGPKAASPIDVLEQNWADEQWTRGCSMAHFPTGVLTQYGSKLREPVGRLHWAGTETATTSYGAMDGAVRSGERVTEEILQLSN